MDRRQKPHSPSQINQCGSGVSALAVPDADAIAMQFSLSSRMED
jgi:hypothetical protein